MDESDVMALLDAAEPPLVTCRRLFFGQPAAQPPPLALLPADAAASLFNTGFTVLHGLLPRAATAAARSEALALSAAGALRSAAETAHAAPNPGGKAFTDASARGDDMTWLHPGEPPASGAPGLTSALELLTTLRDDLAKVLRLQGATEFQLAVYPAGSGASYARHRDAFPEDGGGAGGGQRRVTLVVYASGEEGWDEERDGGALVLYPPSHGAQNGSDDANERGPAEGGGGGGAARVVVSPAAGDVVVFLSGCVEHEVAPVRGAPRVAVSCWCS